jgi:hypothetical protein
MLAPISFNDVNEDRNEGYMATTHDVKDPGEEHGKPSQETTILVNNREVTMPDDHATGAEIEAAADAEPSSLHRVRCSPPERT